MKTFSIAHYRPLLCLVVLICPELALGQSSDISVKATAKKGSIELSESVRITLSVEGPAPLRVELPKQLLALKATETGRFSPSLRVRSHHSGRIASADPGVSARPVRLRNSLVVLFAPSKSTAARYRVQAEVTVNEPKVDLKPSASMSVTKIEELPPPPEVPQGSLRSLWVVGAILVLAVLIVFWSIRRKSKAVPPRQWALGLFAKLERMNASGMEMADGVSSGLRGFIERQFGLPATRLTTEELLAAAEQASWPVEHTDPLRRLLDECDRAKFAGDMPDNDGCRRLLVHAQDWVDLICPDTRPG